jgi:hypothetical protein
MAAEGGSGGMTSHRLQLPHGTSPQTVLTMIHNVLPDAEAGEHGIDLGDGARLVEDERRPARWTLHTPRVRDVEPSDGLPDSHGYGRAFQDGMPYGQERRLLDLVWSLARRLDGAVVTDSRQRLEPHPCHVRDLAVTSPHALQAEDLLELVQSVEPEATLVPVPPGAETSGYMLQIPLGVPDTGQGIRMSGAGTVLIAADEDEAEDEIHVRVGGTRAPAALAALPWLEDAVDYEIVHLPVDEAEVEVDVPDERTALRWAEIYRRIGLLAGVIVETVGGYVVDLEGFLVDPADLV